MQHIIVNVDDFGLHPAVTRAVRHLSHLGAITSTSILANGPCIADASEFNNTLGFACHLNILRGSPTLNPSQIPSLVSHDLFLGQYSALFLNYSLHKLNLDEVRLEWAAQIEKLLDLGLTLTHLDSEKHIHCWPNLFPIACELAKRYNLPFVRKSYEKTPWFRFDKGGCRSKLLAHWCQKNKAITSPQFPDVVWGIADQGHDINPSHFDAYLKTLPKNAIVEVVCHPGIPNLNDDPISKTYGALSVASKWAEEYDILSKKTWIDVLTSSGRKAIHYGKLL